MPSGQDPHRQHHGRELQRAEEPLVGREDGAEVDEEARGRDGEDEDVFAAKGDAEEQQDEQECGEGSGLHRETGRARCCCPYSDLPR